MRSLIPLSLLIAVFDSPVQAAIFPFHVRIGHPTPSSLKRRDNLPIHNTGNAQYVSNITLGGVELPVLLDTGSSDLWVTFPTNEVPTAQLKDTGKSVTLAYAVGKAGGHVQTTMAKFGNISVADQAFLYVSDTSTFTTDIHSQGYDGLLGLGPNEGSVIRKKVDDDTANTLLQRIFEGDKSTDNYITFLLDRAGDTGDPFKGQFTISEIVPGFESITSMPKLDVETVNRLLEADQHWQALTDHDNGIIGPDGIPVKQKSIVPKAPKGQYVAVIDSGFTFSQVPRDVSDAIYGRVKGAFYDTKNEWWLVPCGQYLNVSFNFGGRNYPVHPLDLVDDNFARTDSTGKKVCIGAFQPITSAFSLLGHYDMILGMSFLRNTYTLLDFGDWIDDGSQGHPYIQLSSVIDSEAARQDFVKIRLGGNATALSDSKWELLPADQMQHSPISAEEKKKRYQEMILSRWPYILTGCLVFLILSIGFCVWKCCCKRKARKETTGKKGGLFSSKKAERDSYVPLGTPNRSSHGYSAQHSESNVALAPYTPGYQAQAGYQSQAGYQTQHQNYSQGGNGFSGQQHHV
ncbi:aspartic peptidase A1 [Crassisporium funariophilum]|nr:aspartic peptidase A1 [Crassisporium funariophilum]